MGCQGKSQRSPTSPNDGASRTRKETARSKVRTMWRDESDRLYRSPSYSGTQRPGKIPRTRKTEMGEDHGCQTPQNVDLVSNLSPGRSIWTPTETTAITLMNGTIRRYWKAACSETGTCSLGEGSQKSALAIRQLAGFLSYIEAHFGIMRRLADYYLNKAPALDEMKKAHRKFIRDYNCQIHFAHRERNDNRHSPEARTARRASAYPPSTNAGPDLLCNRVYPPHGSIRIYPLPSMALLCRGWLG